MNIFDSVFGYILAIIILVTFHEFGHFYVARLCSVKVLKFSIGFGPVIYSRKDKSGTEFCLSAIPLGGYVKMLDERDNPVSKDQRQYAFNRKPPWKKIAIVLAGPIFNFILAFVLFYLMYLHGVQIERPVIQYIEPGSIADKAGLKANREIISVDSYKVESFEDLQIALAAKLGTSGQIEIKTIEFNYKKNDKPVNIGFATLKINNLYADINKEPIAKSLGIWTTPKELSSLLVESIDAHTNAKLQDLQVGDIVIGYNGHTINSWEEFVDYIKVHPEQSILIKILRSGKEKQINVTIGRKLDPSGIIDDYHTNNGVLGITFRYPMYLEQHSYGIIDSVYQAVRKAWTDIEQTCYMLYKLLFGQIGLETVRGPVMIAKVAGMQMQIGVSSFLNFLGLISISLGVINLLPIPVLDGGHVVYHLYELISGKQASKLVESIALTLGLIFLGFIMSLAFYNDFIYW